MSGLLTGSKLSASVPGLRGGLQHAGRLLALISCVAVVGVAMGCDHAGDAGSVDAERPDSVTDAAGDTGSVADGGGNAKVVKDDAAFTQKGKTINYGVVLANRSGLDAVNVTIEVSFLGRKGVVVGSDRDTISVIPDGEWYFFGGQVALTEKRAVRRMTVALTTERTVDAQYRLAPVSLVRIVPRRAGVLEVRGRVRNVAERGLSSSARIGVVLFNRTGKAVSGTSTTLGEATNLLNDLTRRSVAGFKASVAAPPDDAAFAEATVDAMEPSP